MYLLEILNNLIEENEEEKIIDNDSMLGSQFSMLSNEIKDDNEDDEIENLNITSLDLNIDSWNSTIEFETKTEDKKTDYITEYNIEKTISTDLPQYDGSSDLILKNKKQLSSKFIKNRMKKERKVCTKSKKFILHFNKNINEFESKHRKLMQTKKKLFCYKDLNIYKLDHQDLDVYDIDEIFEYKLTLYKHLKNPINFEKKPNSISHESYHTMDSILNKLNIPAFDGNTIDSCSDSESDNNITINREEKRICVYKSSIKSKSDKTIDNISAKKRKFKLEDSNLQSTHKRCNLQNESHCTPTKIKTVHSPCSVSKKYSPLNIKIISPKIDKNIKNNEFCNLKSTYNTLKQNNQQLRMNLFHEKINITSESNQGNILL